MPSETTYIFPNQVFLILHHAPWSDSYSTEPASGLGGVVFQGIPHMADDTCKQPYTMVQALLCHITSPLTNFRVACAEPP